MVIAFHHGSMDRRIDPSWWTHLAISRSSPCSTIGATKAWYVLSCLWDDAYKITLGKSSPCGGSGFPLSLSEWSFAICLTPYNRK